MNRSADRVTGVGHWRRLTGKLAGGDGGAAADDDVGGAADDGGGDFRRRRMDDPSESAKLVGARADSSGLRLQRGRRLRLCLVERNTMMSLDARDSQRLERYDRFTERTKTKFMRRRFPTILGCGERWLQAWRSLGVRCLRLSLVAPLQRWRKQCEGWVFIGK
ncbi:hypothetical protein F2Q69_00043485 [Brassica cretica]|uniref:Uncharacterized protein n=1 Tax=Brassica cretica TaxID=69181 RepID=A0A8S9NJC2_BRACR|nr:hypothetical protein F2Q69_00043485 [Brassica cretica]